MRKLKKCNKKRGSEIARSVTIADKCTNDITPSQTGFKPTEYFNVYSYGDDVFDISANMT